MVNMASSKTLSNRFLFGLFFITLPLFIAIRWDYSSFIDAKIRSTATGAGVNYEQVAFSGLSLVFTNIQLNKAGLPQLQLKEAVISPSFSKLFTGDIGASIAFSWNNNPIALDASLQGELLELSNIDASIDLETTSELQQDFIAKASGMVSAQGSLLLNQQTQQLQAADLSLSWTGAKAGLASPEFDLGNISAQLQSSEEVNKPWNWKVQGEPAITLSGTGTLNPENPNPKLWPISGEIEVAIGDNNPTLAMMLQSFAGNKQAKIRLSGTLSNPRTDIIR